MTLTQPSIGSGTDATAAQAGTSTAPTGRRVWRQARVPLALLAVLVTAATVTGLLQNTVSGALDPRSPTPDGALAVATLLTARDVPVRVVGDVPELEDRIGAGATVVVPQPYALTPDELEQIGDLVGAERAALVVVGAETDALDLLGLPVESVDNPDVDVRNAACNLPIALRAGSARTGGVAYDAGRGTGCYPSGGDPTLVSLPDDRATLLGSGDLLTNDRLDQDGNAALALGVLAERPDGSTPDELLWLVPRQDRAALADAPQSLGDLVPDSVVFGLLQVGVAVVVLGLWRSRRLGRVVPEPLPVVVRGAESVEGRARLYRASGAREQAAEALRAGARERLARRLGLPVEEVRAVAGSVDGGRTALVETLAARTGQDPLRMDGVLYGPPPTDDAALVRLADDLDGLDP